MGITIRERGQKVADCIQSHVKQSVRAIATVTKHLGEATGLTSVTRTASSVPGVQWPELWRD